MNRASSITRLLIYVACYKPDLCYGLNRALVTMLLYTLKLCFNSFFLNYE